MSADIDRFIQAIRAGLDPMPRDAHDQLRYEHDGCSGRLEWREYTELPGTGDSPISVYRCEDCGRHVYIEARPHSMYGERASDGTFIH